MILRAEHLQVNNVLECIGNDFHIMVKITNIKDRVIYYDIIKATGSASNRIIHSNKDSSHGFEGYRIVTKEEIVRKILDKISKI